MVMANGKVSQVMVIANHNETKTPPLADETSQSRRIVNLRMGKRAAGFVIFRKINTNFEYLLLQASYGSHHWTPPKGHVDPGESDIETALRETKEEAGFGKDDLKIIESFKKVLQYSVNGVPKTVIYWLAELHKNTPVVLSSEHQDYKWGTLDVACKLSGYKDFQDLLQECEQYLTKNYKK